MIEVHCPNCGKLLFKAEGFGTRIETRCSGCKALLTWPTNVPQVILTNSHDNPETPSKKQRPTR